MSLTCPNSQVVFLNCTSFPQNTSPGHCLFVRRPRELFTEKAFATSYGNNAQAHELNIPDMPCEYNTFISSEMFDAILEKLKNTPSLTINITSSKSSFALPRSSFFWWFFPLSSLPCLGQNQWQQSFDKPFWEGFRIMYTLIAGSLLCYVVSIQVGYFLKRKELHWHWKMAPYLCLTLSMIFETIGLGGDPIGLTGQYGIFGTPFVYWIKFLFLLYACCFLFYIWQVSSLSFCVSFTVF